MRRFIGGLTAFLALSGTILVLPVYAAPAPAVESVEPSITEVPMGSIDEPVADAVVTTDGTVVAAGEDSTAQPGDVVTTDPAEDPGVDAPEASGAPAVASSGDEVAGLPALTVSQPQTAAFSAVGITWAHDPAVTSVVAKVRIQGTDGTWGEWTTLEQDDVEVTGAPAGAEVRDGTAPYFTGPAVGIEAVVQTSDGSTPADVRTQLVDPGTSTADATVGDGSGPQDQAHAAGGMPPVVSRAQWGADEGIRTWDPEYAPTIKAATVHHTADGNDYTADQVPAMMRSIYAFHTLSRGWGDIGYNVVVDKFGRMWEGRYGGLSSTVIGAHAGGFNSGTFGVSMLGNYDTVPVPRATVDAVSEIIAWKFSLYGVNPNGTTQLTSGGGGTAKYSAGTVVTLPTIFGHRDVGNTSCPGQYGYAQLPTIRAQVAGLLPSYAVPQGALDAVSGGEQQISVSGWVYDPDQPRAAVSVHVYVDGRPAAAMTADRSRPDLAAALPGVGAAHGYSGSVSATAGQHTVCVFAINIGAGDVNPLLGCRTAGVTGPVPYPRGALDAVSALGDRVYLSGWTFDDAAPTDPVTVHVYVDGRATAAIPADQLRGDIALTFPRAGDRHGFSTSLRVPAGAHEVCVYAIGRGTGGNSFLGCRSAVVTDQHDPVGAIDAVGVRGTSVLVSGWALDPDGPTSAVTVHVYVDGRPVVAAVAAARRPDVAGLWPGVGEGHGFSATTPLTAGNHQVCVIVLNEGPGSAGGLGCRAAYVDPAAFNPIGVLESVTVSGRSVTTGGWTIDPDRPTEPVAVHLYVDGAPVRAVVADGARPDAASQVAGADDRHGWTASWSLAAGTHSVCAFALNLGQGTANPLLGCRTVTVAASAWDPVGNFDSVSRSGSTATVVGWVWDPDTTSATVHVYVDGVAVRAVANGLSRPDVAAAVVGAPNGTGFRADVAVTAGAHEICVYAINEGSGTTNPLLGCRRVAA